MEDYSQYSFNPTPGPQNPSHYPRTGPHYAQYGDLPGFTYDWQQDIYIPNKNDQQHTLEEAGYGQPKPPGFASTYGPLAGAAGAFGLGSAIASNPSAIGNTISSGLHGLGGIFGLGSNPTSTVAGTASNAVTPTVAGTAGNAAAGAAGTAGFDLSAAAPFSLGSNGGAAGTALGAPTTPNVLGAGFTGGGEAAGAGTFGTGVLPAAGAIAAGAYTGAQQIGGINNAIHGHDMSLPQQAALALPTFGLSLVSNALFGGDKDRWKTESNKLHSLQDDGVFVPQNLIDSMPTHGRDLGSLVDKNQAPDFVGFDSNGNWVNNKFANNRNVKNLVAEDIVNYSAFAENDKDWFNRSMQDRLNIANQALQSGAVKEHHGTIDVDFSKLQGAPTAYSAVQGSKTPLGVGTNSQAPQSPIASTPPNKGPMAMPPKDTNSIPAGGRVRISPGVYKDAKGTYNSKTGVRGQ